MVRQTMVVELLFELIWQSEREDWPRQKLLVRRSSVFKIGAYADILARSTSRTIPSHSLGTAPRGTGKASIYATMA